MLGKWLSFSAEGTANVGGMLTEPAGKHTEKVPASLSSLTASFPCPYGTALTKHLARHKWALPAPAAQGRVGKDGFEADNNS